MKIFNDDMIDSAAKSDLFLYFAFNKKKKTATKGYDVAYFHDSKVHTYLELPKLLKTLNKYSKITVVHNGRQAPIFLKGDLDSAFVLLQLEQGVRALYNYSQEN